MRHNCMVLQLPSRITYRLWAGDKWDRLSVWLCSYQARSHTGCGQIMDKTDLVYDSTAIEWDHIQAMGGNGWDSVSAWCCSYPARSCTDCGCVIGETQSVHASAVIKQDHIQAVSKQWARWDSVSAWFCSYQGRLHTDCGWVMVKKKSQAWFCSHQGDYVQTVGGDGWDSKWVVLQLSSKITYKL